MPNDAKLTRQNNLIIDRMAGVVGKTPLVRLSRLAKARGVEAEILAKLEFLNPAGSVKDRPSLAIIESMEKSGAISPETTVIVATSGKMGIALASTCAAKGLRLIICLPGDVSTERRKLLQLLGAEIQFTPAEDGVAGAMDRAEQLSREIEPSVIIDQFRDPANVEVHRRTTGEEIWRDTGGALDVFVAGVGTGGTITGVGRLLKERDPSIRVVAVEPEDSAVLSGGGAGRHKIEGIGAGFKPEILDESVIDEVLTIGNETAYETARRCAALEGCACGISSGAALAAALEIGDRPEMAGRRIVTILPSSAERYLSTDLFETD